MKALHTIAILILAFLPSASWALDCTMPEPHTEVRLYLGSEYDTQDDNIVSGQTIPPVSTCAIGTVTVARNEPQWQQVATAWAPYEEAMRPLLAPNGPNPFGVTAQGFHIGSIAFVNLARDYSDAREAAVGIADVVHYANRAEGGGPVMRYDILSWSPQQVSDRLIIVYDDGQIISAKVDAWRDACENMDFTLYRVHDGPFGDYQLAPEGFADICSVTFRELAPAQPR